MMIFRWQDHDNSQGWHYVNNVDNNPKHEKKALKLSQNQSMKQNQVEYTNSDFYASLEGKSGQKR